MIIVHLLPPARLNQHTKSKLDCLFIGAHLTQITGSVQVAAFDSYLRSILAAENCNLFAVSSKAAKKVYIK